MIIYIPRFTKRTREQIKKEKRINWLKSEERKEWIKKLHKRLKML